MATYQKHNSFVEALAEKVHNLGADTLKLYLTNVAPDANDAQFSDITEISSGNGYTAGGETLTITSSAQVAGLYSLVMADKVITASGGTIGPFQYCGVVNDTAGNDELLGYFDYGSAITLADGESFTFDQGASFLTLQ